ncbi:unnamed protein product, partial [Linum tenue]
PDISFYQRVLQFSIGLLYFNIEREAHSKRPLTCGKIKGCFCPFDVRRYEEENVKESLNKNSELCRQREVAKGEKKKKKKKTMAWSATMIGALLGLGTQMYSNALRKLPYMRHPWEHVVGMGLGVVFVNQLVKWDEKLQQDLDKMLEKAKAANERRYLVIACRETFGYRKVLF